MEESGNQESPAEKYHFAQQHYSQISTPWSGKIVFTNPTLYHFLEV
jgi:hypothetical protein